MSIFFLVIFTIFLFVRIFSNTSVVVLKYPFDFNICAICGLPIVPFEMSFTSFSDISNPLSWRILMVFSIEFFLLSRNALRDLCNSKFL